MKIRQQQQGIKPSSLVAVFLLLFILLSLTASSNALLISSSSPTTLRTPKHQRQQRTRLHSHHRQCGIYRYPPRIFTNPLSKIQSLDVFPPALLKHRNRGTTTIIMSMTRSTTSNSGGGGTSTSTAGSTKIINRALFGVYIVMGKIILPRLLGQTLKPSNLLPVILSTLWLGFVLCISGMEAWLKFRAPFCPRPYALDIGRTIFPALNSVELALCVCLWTSNSSSTSTSPFSWWSSEFISRQRNVALLLGIPTLILLVEMIYLTPKLVLRGKQVVHEHVKKNPTTAKVGFDSVVFQNLDHELKGIPMAKTDKTHIVYVVLELIKLCSLMGLLSQLG